MIGNRQLLPAHGDDHVPDGRPSRFTVAPVRDSLDLAKVAPMLC
jgi:hypothetical protein